MARTTRTGFDRYFDQRMKDPAFSAEYRQARAEIDATDKLIRALDHVRERSGVTKAELARRISAKPEIVRRLLTVADGNPTMSTVLKLASALGYHLELVSNVGARHRASGSSRAPKQHAPGRSGRTTSPRSEGFDAGIRCRVFEPVRSPRH